MNSFFTLLLYISFFALLIGIIKPNIVLKWMQFERRNRKNVLKYYGIAFIAFSLLAGVTSNNSAATNNTNTTNKSEVSDKVSNEVSTEVTNIANNNSSVNGELKVHFIDVGQADSILIQQGNNSMLIDAGNNDDATMVKNYIAKQGITQLDYVIGTHPHEDHIGGLDYVINSFKIGKIYMPKITTTTQTFQDVITAIKNKNMTITTPVPGSSFKFGDATCYIFGPNSSSYDDLNNYSIIIKINYGSKSFLFEGDAGAISEMEMVNKGYNLKADVLKVGHHGSNTATCANFLSGVNPTYAVISVGKGNSYGHPAQGTMNRLQTANVKVYRTDESGTIILTSNGSDIKFNVNPGSYAGSTSGTSTNTSNSGTTVSSNSSTTSSGGTTTYEPAQGSRTIYWTPSGKSYHYDRNCRTLSRSKTVLQGPASNCPKTDPCNICVK